MAPKSHVLWGSANDFAHRLASNSRPALTTRAPPSRKVRRRTSGRRARQQPHRTKPNHTDDGNDEHQQDARNLAAPRRGAIGLTGGALHFDPGAWASTVPASLTGAGGEARGRRAPTRGGASRGRGTTARRARRGERRPTPRRRGWRRKRGRWRGLAHLTAWPEKTPRITSLLAAKTWDGKAFPSSRGTSSVGRASASQAEGRGFETRVPLPVVGEPKRSERR